jgi:type I restriction enzyme S subunit
MNKVQALAPNFAAQAKSNWKERPLWSLFELKKEIVGEFWTDFTLLSLTKRGVIVRDLTESKGKFPESFDGYQKVQKDDFIFCLFDVQETPRTVGLVMEEGMITSAYTRMVLKSDEVNPQYLEKLMIAFDDFKRFKPFYSGLRNTIQKETFFSTRIALPSLKEQDEIVSFLNKEILEIDGLIARQLELIRSLEQRKAAVIVEVTTKGRNANSSLGNSSIKWIKNYPTHWNVVPLFHLSDERKSGNKGLQEKNLLSLSYGKIVKKDIETNEGLLPESFEGYQIVEENDIVFRFTDLQNDKRSLRSALVEERGIITSAYVAIALRGIDSRYFNYLMRGYDLVKVFYSMGGGLRQSLTYADVRFLPILVPPLEEQRNIAEYLDGEVAQIDELLVTCKLMISELQTRKSALNEAAVLGRLSAEAIRGK